MTYLSFIQAWLYFKWFISKLYAPPSLNFCWIYLCQTWNGMCFKSAEQSFLFELWWWSTCSTGHSSPPLLKLIQNLTKKFFLVFYTIFFKKKYLKHIFLVFICILQWKVNGKFMPVFEKLKCIMHFAWSIEKPKYVCTT